MALLCLLLLFIAFLDRPSTILGTGLLYVDGLTVALSLAYLSSYAVHFLSVYHV